MNVTWDTIPLERARGFIRGYTIFLTPSTGQRKRQNGVVMGTAPPDATSLVVGGLDPSVNYAVTVGASSDEGLGDTSDPVIITASTTGTKLSYTVIMIFSVTCHNYLLSGFNIAYIGVISAGVLVVLLAVVIIVIVVVFRK